MILKVALHVHSTRSDGTRSPNDMLALYHEAGFDVVALTDHDLELTQTELSHLKVPDNMLVLRGSEVSFREYYWQHVGHIWGETKLLRILNHPRRYGMNTDQIEKAVRQFNFDAFEITNQGVYCPQYETLSTVPWVATDDSHYPSMVDKSYMMVDTPEKTGDAIITAILGRNYKIVTP